MELRSEVVVDASAGAAWQVLGEHFGDIGSWAAPITSSTLDGALGAGAVRTCHIARFGPIPPGRVKERLLAFEPSEMRLTYELVEGMPKFIAHAMNRWSIHARGESQCIVRTHATVTLRGVMRYLSPLLRWRFAGDGAKTLEDLKYRIETGQAHPRKLAASARAGGDVALEAK